MKPSSLNPGQQKKRLCWILLLFFITPCFPVYYLLQTVYEQLEKEAYFNARHQAETLVDQLELNIQHLLETEQNRPIAEYSFFNVLENPLLAESTGVKFSPLSIVPAKTDIIGLIGYFQINTDGSFHLPALPEVGQDNLSGLSLAELESRLTLKHKLQNLLSIKITAQSVERKEQTEKIRATSKDVKRRNIRAFIQENEMELDDNISSGPIVKAEKDVKKQADYQTSNVYDFVKRQNYQKGFLTEKKFKTRKEIVQLPDQTMASSYFNRSRDQDASILSKQNNREPMKKNTMALNQKTSSSAINVLRYESEVSPLQLLQIGKDYFCLYRYVWHDNNRFTQGFIIQRHPFLNAITANLLNSTLFSRLIFTTQGNPIQEIELNDIEQEYPLYSRNLSSPFQKIALEIKAKKITDLQGGFIIDLLGLAIYCIFFIGFLAIYRLSSRQIDLAKQQQDFISAVSHELKTPLTSIRMYGEMLRSGWISDESKKQTYYDFIFFESERLSRLINNVLQLARLGHQKHRTEMVIMPAKTLFNKILPRVKAQIEASSFQLKSMALELAHEISPLTIKVDEDAFFQMVINIVDNAIKYTNQSELKQIDMGINVTKNRQTVIFFIRDYGPGIKKNQLKKIFQLFYRSGDELTRMTSGTGIGLALVAQLAETMNAKIIVVNKQPGVEFQIKLPIV